MFTNQHSQISIESAHTFLGGDTHAKRSFDPVPLAALSHVCLAILNLDEALTRE